MKKRIALFGYYGRNNFGDDLFVFVMSRLISAIPNATCLSVVNSLKVELQRDGIRVPSWLGSWVTRNDTLGAGIRYLLYLLGVSWANYLVFAGGSLFGQNASIRFVKNICLMAKFLNKPVSAIGVSVGPFLDHQQKRSIFQVLRNFKKIDVRDAASVRDLRALSLESVSMSGDIVLALPAVYRPRRGGGRRELVISIHLDEFKVATYETARYLIESGVIDEIRICSLDEESNITVQVMAEYYSSLGVPVTVQRYLESICGIIDVIANAKFVVTSKLHGGITAYAYGVPFILFPYQRKCEDFLSENGLPIPSSASLSQGCIKKIISEAIASKRELTLVHASASASARRLSESIRQMTLP